MACPRAPALRRTSAIHSWQAAQIGRIRSLVGVALGRSEAVRRREWIQVRLVSFAHAVNAEAQLAPLSFPNRR